MHSASPQIVVRPRTVPLRNPLPPLGYVVQPIVDLGSGAVTAMEVLARPTDGTRVCGWTELDLAHRSHDLLRGALQRAATLPHRDGVLVHVNMTAVDLARPTLLSEVREYGPERRDHLVLELTEQLELRDTPATWRNLRALRRMGLRLALDDFGEGWSTTVTLRHLRPEIVKVTMGGLSGPYGWDANLAAWVRDRAQAVGCTQIVVERIETPACAAWVREQGFTLAQGHAIDRVIRRRADRASSNTRRSTGATAAAPRPQLQLLRSA